MESFDAPIHTPVTLRARPFHADKPYPTQPNRADKPSPVMPNQADRPSGTIPCPSRLSKPAHPGRQTLPIHTDKPCCPAPIHTDNPSQSIQTNLAVPRRQPESTRRAPGLSMQTNPTPPYQQGGMLCRSRLHHQTILGSRSGSGSIAEFRSRIA